MSVFVYVGVCERTGEPYPAVRAALLRTRFIGLRVDAAPTEIKEKTIVSSWPSALLSSAALPCAEDASGSLSGCIMANLYGE